MWENIYCRHFGENTERLDCKSVQGKSHNSNGETNAIIM